MIFADGSEVWKALLALKQKNVKFNGQYERGLLCSVISICSANFVVDWIENGVNDIKKVKPKVANGEKPGIIKYLKGSAPLGEVLRRTFTGGWHFDNLRGVIFWTWLRLRLSKRQLLITVLLSTKTIDGRSERRNARHGSWMKETRPHWGKVPSVPHSPFSSHDRLTWRRCR